MTCLDSFEAFEFPPITLAAPVVLLDVDVMRALQMSACGCVGDLVLWEMVRMGRQGGVSAHC